MKDTDHKQRERKNEREKVKAEKEKKEDGEVERKRKGGRDREKWSSHPYQVILKPEVFLLPVRFIWTLKQIYSSLICSQ